MSYITSYFAGNFLYLSSESLSDANDDDEVREWKDISGNGRDVSVNSGCGMPRYGKASWNPRIPVVKFGYSGGQSCLKTKSAYPVSTSGTYLAVVSWTGDGGPGSRLLLFHMIDIGR